MNPIVSVMEALGYVPMLPTASNSEPIRYLSRANHLVTTPSAHNFLPMFRPGGFTENDWIDAVQKNYTMSAMHFCADIWTQILARKSKTKTNVHMLWDDEIPLPTPATALFWLLMCESYPLPIGWSQMPVGGMEYIAEQGMQGIFPPQPFTLPQSQHSTTLTIHPVGLLRSRDRARHLLPIEFGRSLTQRDRAKLENTPSWWQPIFMPEKPTLIEDHFTTIVDGPSISRRVAIQYNTFVNAAISIETCGYGLGGTVETFDHLYQLYSLRNHLMHNVEVIPGLPSCEQNTYGPTGAWIRGYSEGVTNILPHPSDMRANKGIKFVNEGSVNVEDQLNLIDVPLAIPGFWFGFTGHGLWDGYNETSKAAWRWAQAYLSVRLIGLRMLMAPQSLQWEPIIDSERNQRTNKLRRAGLINEGNKTLADKMAEAAFALNIIGD